MSELPKLPGKIEKAIADFMWANLRLRGDSLSRGDEWNKAHDQLITAIADAIAEADPWFQFGDGAVQSVGTVKELAEAVVGAYTRGLADGEREALRRLSNAKKERRAMHGTVASNVPTNTLLWRIFLTVKRW